MANLRVETLWNDMTVVEATANVKGDLTADVRERMLSHVVSDLVDRVLRAPGTNPRGLIVTVTSDDPSDAEPLPDFRVLASAPTYLGS